MSEFNLIWRRYNLRNNPYFITPLTIDNTEIPLSSFIGRIKEKEELKKIISLGGNNRALVIGEPGVGKTSLVNYIRNEFSEKYFFTPIKEIEINRPMSSNEFIILTLSSIYSEIQRKDIILKPHIMQKLEALYELTQLGELSNEISNLTNLNTHKLISLFKDVTEDLTNPRFNGIILHYDNWDNIDDVRSVLNLLGEIRDFLLCSNKIIFLFVGDNVFSSIINLKPRISQIFISPPIEVNNLSFIEIKDIFEKRIELLKIENSLPVCPHSEESLKVLYSLFNGNLREILNSLTNCVLALPPSNTPIIITPELMKELLYKKVKECYLDKISPAEKEILNKIISIEFFTPSELSKMSGKNLQNISSKYIPKLVQVGAIRFRKAEGRNKFYSINPQIKWLMLKPEAIEKIKNQNKIKAKEDKILKTLKDFM